MIDIRNDVKEYYAQNFIGFDCSNSEYDEIEFEECTFKECEMTGSTFFQCKFVNCTFLKCNLSMINWKSSRFTDVTFDQCKIIGVDWTTISWSNIAIGSPIKFYECILNDASFFGLSLEEIVIEKCKADSVDFREARFCNANFSDTNFSNSLFNNTNLAGVDFTDAQNYRIDIHFNEIKGAKFCRLEAISLLEGLEIELVD